MRNPPPSMGSMLVIEIMVLLDKMVCTHMESLENCDRWYETAFRIWRARRGTVERYGRIRAALMSTLVFLGMQCIFLLGLYLRLPFSMFLFHNIIKSSITAGRIAHSWAEVESSCFLIHGIEHD